ncbi:hemerythrin domain-containing protein [Streptomyces sp. 7R007]
MPARENVLALLRAGCTFEDIGERLGIHPGLAYMIATGLPADGGDVLGAEELSGREGLLPGSSQHLVNPSAAVPTRDPTVDAWLRRRAHDDQPMREAAARRTPRPPELADQEADDLLTVLGRDHNQVKYLQEQLEATPGVRQGGGSAQQQRRVTLVGMIRERLTAHEAAEEKHFWPAVRTALSDGEDLARQGREQEREGARLLAELDGLPGDADRFDELVEQLAMALRKHVAFEDGVLLRLQDILSAERRQELGRRVLLATGHRRAPADAGRG